MFGCVISSKQYHLENENLFIDDSLKVYALQIPENDLKVFKNSSKMFPNYSIMEVRPKSIVMLIGEEEVEKLFANHMTNFRKILYEGNVLWINSDNLFIFREKKIPSEIMSLNKFKTKKNKI